LYLKTERKKILIVDDETDMIIFLSTLMETHGFEPIIAGNSEQALHKAADEHPDCIILDNMMSKEEGILLYISLREDKQLKDIPVIMLSALPDKVFLHYQKFRSSISGVTIPEPEAYLENPPEAEKLIRAIRKLLRSEK
jgi:two-component system, OmpR family, phosphate regulon response regulator PhoB